MERCLVVFKLTAPNKCQAYKKKIKTMHRNLCMAPKGKRVLRMGIAVRHPLTLFTLMDEHT